MKRLSHVAMLLVAVSLVAAAAGEKKEKGDAEKIKGDWFRTTCYHKGKEDSLGNLHYKLANPYFTSI
jgi:hypothetical protein